MLGNYFYHEIIRKTVIAFGTLFNDIHVRHDDGAGNVISEIKVPVALVLYRCACTHTTARAEEWEYPWRPATSQLLLEKFLNLIKYEVVDGLGDAPLWNF